jgi:hypothetical protein
MTSFGVASLAPYVFPGPPNLASPEYAAAFNEVRCLAMWTTQTRSARRSPGSDFHAWRPGDAIREAGTDGNPETEADIGWTPRNGTFGSTLEYPSGTATFAGAASKILAGFYCTDRVPFAFSAEPLPAPQPPRSYTRFSKAADEAGRSRDLQRHSLWVQ